MVNHGGLTVKRMQFSNAFTMENGHLTVKMSPMTNGNRWPLQMRQSSTRSRRMRDRAAGGTELGTTGAAGGLGKPLVRLTNRHS